MEEPRLLLRLLFLLLPQQRSSDSPRLAVVPDVYQGSRGRQGGPSAAVALLCLLGDGGPDSSAPA